MRIDTFRRASAGARLALVFAVTVMSQGYGTGVASGQQHELGAIGASEDRGDTVGPPEGSDGTPAAEAPGGSADTPTAVSDETIAPPPSGAAPSATEDSAPGAASPLPAATSPASADPPLPVATTPDYYSRRARETLAQDAKLSTTAPHPLAAAYPEHDVVVCEAGCANDYKPEIVSLRPKSARVITQSMMVPTSSDSPGPISVPRSATAPLATEAQSRAIDCIGGCYDTPKRYRARVAEQSASPKAGQSGASATGGWATTVTREGGHAEPVAPAVPVAPAW
jgi:hypothetical protein